MVTHRRPDGRYERFTSDAPSSPTMFDTSSADLYDRTEPSSPT